MAASDQPARCVAGNSLLEEAGFIYWIQLYWRGAGEKKVKRSINCEIHHPNV